MTTKVYGIWGRSKAIVQVKTGSGRAYVEADFDRGIPTEGPNYRPATFSTSDPVVQHIMESSPMFGTLYVLYKVWSDEAPAKASAPAKETKKPEPEAIEGVTSREEAVEYLKQRGAKAVNLKTDEAMKSFAEKIGVTFPNYTI